MNDSDKILFDLQYEYFRLAVENLLGEDIEIDIWRDSSAIIREVNSTLKIKLKDRDVLINFTKIGYYYHCEKGLDNLILHELIMLLNGLDYYVWYNNLPSKFT